MKRWLKTTITLLSIAIPLVASANGASIAERKLAEGPTPYDLVSHAIENNPSITAAKEKWRGSIERFRLVTGLPEPQLMVTYFPQPIETRLGPQEWNLTLQQAIPFPGELTKAGEVAKSEAKIARADLDRTVRNVSIEVKKSLYELWYIRRATEVAKGQANLLREMETLAGAEYVDGGAKLYDLVKAQSQRAQLGYDLILLEELERTETAKLNSLLNREPGGTIGPITVSPIKPLALTLDEILKSAVEEREELLIAQAKIEAAEAKRERARYANYPDFKVGLFYAGIGDPDVPSPPSDAGQDAYGVQLGMTIPLWGAKNTGRESVSEATYAAAIADKQSIVNETGSRVHALYYKLGNASRLVELYRDTLLPQATEAVGNAEVWFRQQEGSFTDFIEAQSSHYNFQLSLVRARADYGKFLAELEGVAGRSLTATEGEETK